jgi:hypothetical protein
MRLRFCCDLSAARRLKGADAPVEMTALKTTTELAGGRKARGDIQARNGVYFFYWALAAVFWVCPGLGRRAFKKSATGRVLRTSFFSSQPRRAMVTP